MSLSELLPAIRSLHRNDKLELFRELSQELAPAAAEQSSEEALLLDRIVQAAQFDWPRPEFSSEAAVILQKLLDEQQVQRA